VHIEQLSIANFRNLEGVDVELSAANIVLRGQNGHGKTNLIEAVYLAATGRTFRGALPRDMVAFGRDEARIAARFVRQEVRHAIEVRLTPRARTVRVDDRLLRQTARLIDLVNVVAFFPDDLRIIKGEPEMRRRFLDRAVANCRPEMVEAALAYQRALRSRNALLRDQAAREQVRAYDEPLIAHGSLIHRCRVEVLAALAPHAVAIFAAVSRLREPLTVRLHSGVADSDLSFGEAMRAELAAAYGRDQARGMTSVGPHRADLVLSIGGHAAREFASQGQQRAMVLALKLAELRCLRERVGVDPVLLLDDVSSELDAERTRDLFAALREYRGQVWLTTTGSAPLPIAEDAQVFAVESGHLRAIAWSDRPGL